jgi:PleD family two-component response regulator
MNVQSHALNRGVTGTVLVVDDEPRNRTLLVHLLRAQGHDTIEAVDGTDGIAQACKHSPHTILLDIMMPGPDGIEICRRLKENPATAAIPVLMVTSVSDRDAMLAAISAGADDFISKPVDKHELALRVSNAVHRKRLIDDLHAENEQLRLMIELKDSLTRMITDDTAALTELLHAQRATSADVSNPTAETKQNEEKKHVGN